MDQNEVIVSVCCITYNHAPYIRQCLDGFMMQQTNFAFEVLIHDDASTDGTTEIIKEYEAKYPEIIKPIYEEENQWIKGRRGSAVFNFPRAKGKFIALCEGDDYWTDPLKLQKQVDFLGSNPEYSMCFHRANIINEFSNDRWLQCEEIEEREYSANELFLQWLVPTASMVYKAEVNTLPIIHNRDVLNSDIILVLKCCRHGKVMALKDFMSVYRMHKRGVTYSERLAKERLLKYPKHYLCIKRNFGDILDKNYLNKRIAESYWNIRELRRNFFHSQLIKIIAFFYAPRLIISKYLHRG